MGGSLAMIFVAIFISVVATYWWTVGIWASDASPSLYCIPLIMSALIIVSAFRREWLTAVPCEARGRIWRAFGIATGLEGVAILAAFNVFPAMRATDFSASVQAIIIGLHFILLARLLPVRLYYLTGALLVSLGTTGFAIGNADLHIQYVCLGGAFTFWLSYGMMMRTGYRRCQSITNAGICA
jgi:hypothetical protein